MTTPTPPPRSIARRLFRVARWGLLASGIVVVFLILRPKDPPEVMQDPEAPQRLEAKLARFATPAAGGGATALRLDEAELNAWMRSSLSLAPTAAASATTPSQGAPQRAATAGMNAAPQEPISVEEMSSKVLDVQTHMEHDLIVAHVLFELYGKNVSLELRGHLGIRNGYLRLDPTALWIGSLPIPESTVRSAVDRLFSDPAHRETFRVPAGIRDIRVQDGQLVIDRP
jgi:hypothetical protein